MGLDAGAAARVPDLAGGLPVGDLRRAGWHVTGPATERDGRTWVRATRTFLTPDELGRVLAEVGGRDGPFRSLRLTQSRGVLHTRTALAGVVDLRRGLDAFVDADLRRRLGVTSLALDRTALERELGQPLDRAVVVTLDAELPGGVKPSWSPRLGQAVPVTATSVAWNVRRTLGAAVAGLALAALAVVLLLRTVRRRAGT